MTNIYYIQVSGSTPSSVTISPATSFLQSSLNSNTLENNFITFADSVLTITASAYETSGSLYNSTVGTLRAYITSGSITYASFPIESVNIFYDVPYTNPSTPTTPTSFASLDINFSTINVVNAFMISNKWGYYISSSDYFYYNSGSVSTGSIGTSLIADSRYILAISSSSEYVNYSSSLTLYDITFGPGPSSSIGNIIYHVSGTLRYAISASFYPTSSYTYLAVLYVSGS